MSTYPYPPPVSALLTAGEPETPWPDYPAVYGFSASDIPDLIRLSLDRELRWEDLPENEADTAEAPQVYAQIHAWRALGQLKAVDAIPALISLLDQVDSLDDDWWQEESEEVFALLGPAAVGALQAAVLDGALGVFGRGAAGDALEAIARQYPEERTACLEALAAGLRKYSENDETLNAFLVYALSRQKAVEYIDLIKEAFEAERVDEFVMGDFEDVQVEMGLQAARISDPGPNRLLERFFGAGPGKAGPGSAGEPAARPHRQQDPKIKKKRKQEKKSRRKNRKK